MFKSCLSLVHKTLKLKVNSPLSLFKYLSFLFLLLTASLFTHNTYAQNTYNRPACIGFTGDTTDVKATTKGGVALIGGGGTVDGAFKWMIERSGGGNAVIIRASGDFLYNGYIDSLGKLSSVETLLIDSRDVANNDTVARAIRNAEMLFITGGDQSNYMNFWRGTKTAAAINYLLNIKKVPVGGTSAGCAILSGIYYSGERSSATAAILQNPYDTTVTLYNNDFLKPPYLKNVLTDQHYVARNRAGRHVTFLARAIKDWNVYANGIAPDERTAVCVDAQGNAVVIGKGKAYFLQTNKNKPPEICTINKPLQWLANKEAIRVYEIQGSPVGNGFFDVRNFDFTKAEGGTNYWWWVENGELKKQQIYKH